MTEIFAFLLGIKYNHENTKLEKHEIKYRFLFYLFVFFVLSW